MFFLKKKPGVSWLIAGLGNPGQKYASGRHNVGFMVLDLLAESAGLKIDLAKYKSLYRLGRLGGEQVMLLKPQTYMNLSGEAVLAASRFYKLPPENILVIADDISLPLGKLRLRKSGSSGGHKGLESIISRLGSQNFPRIKIGVGDRPHPDYDMADWVLSSFSPQEKKVLDPALARAAEAVTLLLSSGFDKAANTYN